jgi:hypothetical protein
MKNFIWFIAFGAQFVAHFEYESVVVDFKQIFMLKEKNEMVGILTPNIWNRTDDSVTSMDEFGIID